MQRSRAPQSVVRVASLALCYLAIVACATIRTGTHYDETVDFSSYKTFAWIDEQPHIAPSSSIPVSALALEHLHTAIRSELTGKGYTFVEDRDEADFVVAFTIGTRDRIVVDSYPPEYRGSWGWHVPYSQFEYREVGTHTYTSGTLGVDIFDNESGRPVWHGWAEKTITTNDRDDPRPTIQDGIARLFQDFPR